MIVHKTKTVLESQLAKEIAKQLESVIKEKGSANLLVSGGSTPLGMYHLLSLKQLDWSKVTIALVDERHVLHDDDSSNEEIIKTNLLINQAKEARYISMHYVSHNEEENLRRANLEYERFHNNIDICVLGMGADGRTASLFPNDKKSEQDLEQHKLEIIRTKPPREANHRISCSKGLLLGSDVIYIMITGAEKKRVLKRAAANKYPISYFTNPEHSTVEIYYAEN